MRRLKNKGQATSELLLLIPLFVILAGGMLCICFMCWEGLKVQEAANLAARMQGQERIGGGPDPSLIDQDNLGVNTNAGDVIPDKDSIKDLLAGQQIGAHHAPSGGVYGRIYTAVHGMFAPKEWDKLFIEQPKQGITTDSVHVARVIVPPQIWAGFKLKPIMLEATAYGGEDTHMYGLPRWGRVGNQGSSNSTPFYAQKGIVKGKD